MTKEKKTYYYGQYDIENIVDFDIYNNPDYIRQAYVRDFIEWLIEWIMKQKLEVKNGKQ
jgi:hypothetical protein